MGSLRRLSSAGWGIFVLCALATTSAFAAALPVPKPDQILTTLRPEHPRLLATRADFDRIQRDVTTDPQLIAWWKKIRTDADTLLKSEPAKYEIPDGLRLLNVSRKVLARAHHLGLAWQITKDRRYSDRLAAEFTAVADFKDWNPRHFLDTAEMAHAFGLGYDWCFDAWSPEQRARFRAALISKALEPALKIQQESASKGGWPNAHHNWNQVCNGGITIGALALAEDAPQLSGELVADAAVSIQNAMSEFAPDGAWAEGPAYWNYAAIYNVVFLAALDSALGTDFGLSGLPGFPQTGFYPIHITGPLGRTFNYADGRDGVLRAPQLLWLANKFQQPAFARFEKEAATPHPLDVVWYNPKLAAENARPEPLDRYFRGVEVVTLRSAWPTRAIGSVPPDRGLFVGFKGGDNKANHSHLDLGSFVLDALGVRWFHDPGGESYSVPNYFGADRWKYYMTRAEGHNTLVIQPDSEPDQDPKASAPVVQFASRDAEALAVVDLSAAYARHTRKVHRGIALQSGRSQCLIQDEVEADKPAEILWFAQTSARIESQGRTATLSYGQEKLWAGIVSPPDATFSVLPPSPLPTSPNPQGQTSLGGRKLAVRLSPTRETRLAILLVPLAPGITPPDPASVPIRPLAEWK